MSPGRGCRRCGARPVPFSGCKAGRRCRPGRDFPSAAAATRAVGAWDSPALSGLVAGPVREWGVRRSGVRADVGRRVRGVAPPRRDVRHPGRRAVWFVLRRGRCLGCADAHGGKARSRADNGASRCDGRAARSRAGGVTGAYGTRRSANAHVRSETWRSASPDRRRAVVGVRSPDRACVRRSDLCARVGLVCVGRTCVRGRGWALATGSRWSRRGRSPPGRGRPVRSGTAAR